MKVAQHISNDRKLPVDKGFNDRYIDKQDILQRFAISSRTLQRWRSERMVSFSRIGKKIYYLKTDIEELVTSSIVKRRGAGNQAAKANPPAPVVVFKWAVHPFLFPAIIITIYILPLVVDLASGEQISFIDLVSPFLMLLIGLVIYLVVRLFSVRMKKPGVVTGK